jgi:hypothetical protein
MAVIYSHPHALVSYKAWEQDRLPPYFGVARSFVIAISLSLALWGVIIMGTLALAGVL